jgi:hypothetical protein
MRIATLSIVFAALASAGSALALIGPPQPPVPTGQTVPSTGTGLIGYVSRGPVTPRCTPGRACFTPAHVTLRFGQQATIVARTATRTTGTYRIALKPGVYTVSVTAGLGRLRPSTVTVPATGWKRVNFVLTTGIY